MSDVEKSEAFHVEESSKSGSDSPVGGLKDGFETEFTLAEQKKIIHRVDRRLIIMVGLMYCVSLIDRTNLSVANVAGMKLDLGLGIGYRYSIITLVFFITYIVFQPPSTVIVRRLGPRIHLGTITVVWGGIMIGMGFVKSWQTLAGLRVLLGVLEAGFFPSCVYLLSTWYIRYETGVRYSYFYIIGCVSSAFAGILAYGLMQMEGLAGIRGWSWIFIMEGILTCIIGISGFILLVGFPDDAKRSWRFLNDRETKFIIDRVNADRGDAHTEPFNLKKFISGGNDLKVWLFALIYFNTTTITYALAFFLPIILQEGLGFDVGESQCLVAPPYALAGLLMFAMGHLGDKFRLRGPIIVFNMLLCIIGLPIVGWHSSAAVRYFGVFLVTAGANTNIPQAMTYQANNIRGQWKRAFCSATLVGFGGIGGIAGSLVFRTQDSPEYHNGIWACIACSLLNIILVGWLSLIFKRENRKVDAGRLNVDGSEVSI
ncbi:MFS general substrate transporter [Aulographum hederae CBS 113979]|uniref:MFS general substrate transporter n=1 Tax=Aulographum hederae CBS 113979 TaxID=1176131 RepID=A0A6G1GX37_9PEZI|nr:MFS general substrate transporter [Aulographum hederae CBS 113979]